MALKVFLSYSLEAEEQVIALRLQTLAAAHGIHLYVPPRPSPRLPSRASLSAEVRSAIDRADFVLAIITTKTRSAVGKELNYAMGRNKTVIPVVEKGAYDSTLQKNFDQVLVFSVNDPPGKLEYELTNFLKKQSVAKEQRQALGALVAIGLGMFLLASLAKQ